ncbi:unnamed protein product [Allacma fusca]|uniref:Uncharacterized protein n=1 Tax=Allacma fusca TaxID=39272 RepID=A0A8J2P4Z7_9HEXA|nr:unnamed protein product [Allacma fusca]
MVEPCKKIPQIFLIPCCVGGGSSLVSSHLLVCCSCCPLCKDTTIIVNHVALRFLELYLSWSLCSRYVSSSEVITKFIRSHAEGSPSSPA